MHFDFNKTCLKENMEYKLSTHKNSTKPSKKRLFVYDLITYFLSIRFMG